MMEPAKLSSILLNSEISTQNKSIDQQQLDLGIEELNKLTKLCLGKIDALKIKQFVSRSKSRSGSVNEIPPYSPTKFLNDLNFYSNKNGFKDIEHHLDDDYNNDIESINNSQINDQFNTEQTRRDSQISNKLLQLKQIKHLNELLLLNRRLSLSEQFELDSLYSSSTEPNRDWQLDDSEFILQCLNRHNYFRKLHNVPNLNLSQNLINYSRDWVEILARNDRLEKRFSNRYGENVFAMQLDDESTNLNGAIPVDHWYYQGNNYDYTSQYPKNSTCDFTQLIWKSTRFIGVACARSKTNRIFVVASYSQSGNFPRQMVENVLPISQK